MPDVRIIPRSEFDRVQSSNLDRAEKLKAEAESVLAQYQATVAEAEAEAQAILRAGADAFAEQSAAPALGSVGRITQPAGPCTA